MRVAWFLAILPLPEYLILVQRIIRQEEMPASFASVSQCLVCGRLFPVRISVAYG